VEACLFDLDGVLTDTASVHRAAWKALFDDELKKRKLSPPFSDDDYNDYVDGKPRDAGVRSFLASRHIEASDTEIEAMGATKNRLFLEKLHAEGVHVFPGTVEYLKAVRAAGLRTAVVTSSANCQEVIDAAGLTQYLEVRVDGNSIRSEHLAGKPAPDTYVFAAKQLGVDPAHAVIYEDALAGVEAGKRGKFAVVVGVDRLTSGTGTHAKDLAQHGATQVVSGLAQLLGNDKAP
jgi:beta-phosphoglucomutase family hydrolase